MWDGGNLYPSLSGVTNGGNNGLIIESGDGLYVKETPESGVNPAIILIGSDNLSSGEIQLATTTKIMSLSAEGGVSMVQNPLSGVGIGADPQSGIKLNISYPIGSEINGNALLATLGDDESASINGGLSLKLGAGGVLPDATYIGSAGLSFISSSTANAIGVYGQAVNSGPGPAYAGYFSGNVLIDSLGGSGTKVVCTNNDGLLSNSGCGSGGSQWDDVTGGINYGAGHVGVGSTTPYAKLAITPDPQLGTEEITNQGFTGSATGWNLGTDWNYTTDAIEHTPGTTDIVTQTGTLDPSKTYRVQIVFSGGTAGDVNVCLDGGTCKDLPYNTPFYGGTFDGTWVNVDGVKVSVTPSSDYDGSIDFLSVREVLTSGPAFSIDEDTPGYGFNIDRYDLYNAFPGVFNVPLMTGTSHAAGFGDQQILAAKGSLVILPPDNTNIIFGADPSLNFWNPTNLQNASISLSTSTMELTIDGDGTTTVASTNLNLTGGGCFMVNGVCIDSGAGAWQETGNLVFYNGDSGGASAAVLNDYFPAYLLGNADGMDIAGFRYASTTDSLDFVQADGGYTFDSHVFADDYFNVGSTTQGYQMGGIAYFTASTTKKSVNIGQLAGNINSDPLCLYGVAIGYHALQGDICGGGASNIAIGGNAMGNIPALQNNANIAIGESALQQISNGSGNVALGYLALGSAGQGAYNTAIGDAAMNNSGSPGDFNTAVGGGTLGLLSGGRNTFLGAQRTNTALSGSRNTCLGWNNCLGSVVFSGDSNIVIGQNIGPASSTLSNQLNIGGVLYGTGMFSGTNDFFNTSTSTANGTISVGTSTPNTARFSVDGDVYIASSTRGIILMSPDGTCARGTISNIDVLTFNSITCP